MTNAILPLNATGADLDTVGGKGRSLMNMVAAGFSVPAGFCVTTGGNSRAFAGVALANLVVARATIVKQPAVLATGIPMPDRLLR